MKYGTKLEYLPRYAHDECRQNFINYPVNVTFVFAFAIVICISVQVTRFSNGNGLREIVRITRNLGECTLRIYRNE